MKKFSYALEFYNNGTFSLDESKTFEKEVKIAEATEDHFKLFTNEIEAIRDNILISYKFKKELPLEDRINYVRGIVYARQFMDEKDVIQLIEEFDRKDKYIYEKSLFSIRTLSDEFDYAFYHDYIQNCIKDDDKSLIETSEKLSKLVKQAREAYERALKAPDEGIVKDNSVMLQDDEDDDADYDDYPEEEFEDEDGSKTRYSIDELTLMERFMLAKEYFPVYQEGIYKTKGITKEDKCYQMVNEGMTDYNNYIMNLFEDTYNFMKKEFFRSTKNLTLVI